MNMPAAYGRVRKRDEKGLLNAFAVLTARNRRRYGGYIIHIGVVMMAIGIIGIEMFQSETQGTVPQGGQIEIGALYHDL